MEKIRRNQEEMILKELRDIKKRLVEIKKKIIESDDKQNYIVRSVKGGTACVHGGHITCYRDRDCLFCPDN